MISAARRTFSNPAFLRASLLAGLAVGLLAVGVLAPRMRPELTLMAAVVPALGLFVLNRPELGVLVIILTAAFVRFSLPTGTQSRIVASLLATALVIVVWIVQMVVRDRHLRLRPSSTNVPLLAFILTAIISYAWSNAFRDPLVVAWRTWPLVQLGGLAVMILLPGAFLLTVNRISEVRWLELLCWSMIVIGVLSLAAHFLGIRLAFLNTGGLFSLWFVSLAYGQALLNRKLPFWLRVVLLGLVLIWIYVYFIERVTWLAGWLPPLAAVAAISLLRSRRLFLVLLLLMTAYMALNWDYYTATVWAAERATSGLTRLAAWELNWKVSGKHLLFGTGPAGYAVYYMSYFPTKAMATHSNYLDLLSQTGVVGSCFLLWFLGALGWTGFRLCQRLKAAYDFGEGFAIAAFGAWLGCVVAMAFGDWMLPFVYTQTIAGFDHAVYSWILLGGIVSLADIHDGRWGGS